MNAKRIIGIILLSSILIASNSSLLKSSTHLKNTSYDQEEIVFVEYTTATWCPQCPIASETLHDLSSNDSLLYFVTLVIDQNEIASKRNKEYTNYVIPSVYFNGGFVHYIGGGESLTDTYTNLIDETRQNQKQKNLEMNGSIQIINDSILQLSIDVTNHGNHLYVGKIRTYITEKNSRWKDYGGNQYHFGFLDFAMNENIRIKKGETITLETQWNPTDTSTNLTFPDINYDNIQIFSSISHWIPHFRTGYLQFPYIQFYFARYTDQVISMIP